MKNNKIAVMLLLAAAHCIVYSAEEKIPTKAPPTLAELNEIELLTNVIVKAPLELKPNSPVDEQFRQFATRSGWNLMWQAPEYVLDHKTTIAGDFESALATFLKSANESGVRLRAMFFRGNKTVRVEEF